MQTLDRSLDQSLDSLNHCRSDVPIAPDDRHRQISHLGRNAAKHCPQRLPDCHRAVRRVQTKAGTRGLAEALDWTKLWMFNTAGCQTAEEAIRVARLGRDGEDWGRKITISSN